MDTVAESKSRKSSRNRVLVPWASGFIAGAIICGLVSWLLVFKPSRDIMEKSLALKPAGDARVSLLLLEELQSGNTQRAIDILQMQLNGNILAMGADTGVVADVEQISLDESSSAYIQETLQKALTYFEKYPRTPQSDPAFAAQEQIIAKTLEAAAAVRASNNAP